MPLVAPHLSFVLALLLVPLGDLSAQPMADESEIILSTFNVRPEESVADYAAWARWSELRMLRALGLRKASDLRPGEVVALRMTRAQWRRFREERKSRGPSRFDMKAIDPFSKPLRKARPRARSRPPARVPPRSRSATLADGSVGLQIKVEPGESVRLFAYLSDVPVPDLVRANRLENADRIRVGAWFTVPIPKKRWPAFRVARAKATRLREALALWRGKGHRIVRVRLRPGEDAAAAVRRVGAVEASLAGLNPTRDPKRARPGITLRMAVPGRR